MLVAEAALQGIENDDDRLVTVAVLVRCVKRALGSEAARRRFVHPPQDVAQTGDDQGEPVVGQLHQAFLVVLLVQALVRRLRAGSIWQLGNEMAKIREWLFLFAATSVRIHHDIITVFYFNS